MEFLLLNLHPVQCTQYQLPLDKDNQLNPYAQAAGLDVRFVAASGDGPSFVFELLFI